jgi:hypothetical protein
MEEHIGEKCVNTTSAVKGKLCLKILKNEKRNYTTIDDKKRQRRRNMLNEI